MDRYDSYGWSSYWRRFLASICLASCLLLRTPYLAGKKKTKIPVAGTLKLDFADGGSNIMEESKM